MVKRYDGITQGIKSRLNLWPEDINQVISYEVRDWNTLQNNINILQMTINGYKKNLKSKETQQFVSMY